MNNILKSLITLSTLTAGSAAFGQGLLSIRPQKDEFEKRLPFTFTVDVGAGWDSNTNVSNNNKNSSGYISGGVGTQYSGGDRRTNYNVSASYGVNYYLDPAPGENEFLQNARLSASFRHKFDERTSIVDSGYIAYEFEPNYAIGASTTRRSSEYLYYYNDISVSHAWSRGFSTSTGYTFTGIDYQNSADNGSNYMTHVFHHEFSYALSKLTNLAVDYRYAIANYDSGFGDYTSQYYLIGLDHHFNRALFGTFRVGAETRDRDHGGADTNPYAEGNISYRADKHTTLNAYVRYGFEDSSVGSFQKRESIRLGASASHELTNRLNGSVGAHYIHDTSDNSASGEGGFDEDVFALSVGLDYALYKNVSLRTGYGFTTTSSGNASRDYDRHNISLGLRATF